MPTATTTIPFLDLSLLLSQHCRSTCWFYQRGTLFIGYSNYEPSSSSPSSSLSSSSSSYTDLEIVLIYYGPFNNDNYWWYHVHVQKIIAYLWDTLCIIPLSSQHRLFFHSKSQYAGLERGSIQDSNCGTFYLALQLWYIVLVHLSLLRRSILRSLLKR